MSGGVGVEILSPPPLKSVASRHWEFDLKGIEHTPWKADVSQVTADSAFGRSSGEGLRPSGPAYVLQQASGHYQDLSRIDRKLTTLSKTVDS